jgi:hypothetical protein
MKRDCKSKVSGTAKNPSVFIRQDYHTAIPDLLRRAHRLAHRLPLTGTASAAKYRAEGREMGSDPPIRFVTASLHVDFLLPTPIGVPLEVRGKVKLIKGRRVVVEAHLLAKGKVCAKGEVVVVQMPENMRPGK